MSGFSSIHLVSFPKSGNTWVRFLLGNYLADDRVDFNNYHLYVPDIHQDPELKNSLLTTPRFIKSHYPYRPEYKRTIYLARDGRDVAVSYYYHQKRLGNLDEQEEFSTFLEKFLVVGAGRFGSWGDHVMSWIEQPGVLIVKFEDLLQETRRELERMLEFSGESADPVRMNRAITASAFSEMQRLETQQTGTCRSLQGAVDESIRFVRQGKSGQWRDHFQGDETGMIPQPFATALERLGYVSR